MSKLMVVTGAFGYTGKYITKRLLDTGHQVLTLTGHPERPDPFNGKVVTHPFNFDKPKELIRSLQGADTLFNTYWIRFSHGELGFDEAVENSRILFAAAKSAGLRRIVHISITNPQINSPLPYFHGKALLEEDLRNMVGISHAIIRPTVIFGTEDILINNIAHLLRRFPVFTIPGSGEYKLQPIYVEDLAEIAVDAAEKSDNMVIDAVGPKIYTFRELLEEIKSTIGSRSKLLSIHPMIALVLSQLFGLLVQDVVLTRDEVHGLMDNLLISDNPPTGSTPLKTWLRENVNTLGVGYTSELQRHY